ncbi:enoyl-CoA hydratase-related protein [Marinobacter sp. ATCH36]|uniref:enoyl-CoA hydratase/isomerase family protein n=1 Tax=Marinobacter sp. ATCH36 TaxID=2945106 RepID=UPI0020220B80|nr:enoyl-CoA hydratase-related protein [Marinobacter sp. ATCH36]MCL7945489.1 enoyl-CoA hydratase-related protein [Marinobacter sp. ATCH36]
MAEQLVITHFDPGTGVATLTFNRPEALNAINVPLAEAFRAAVQELKALPGVRCVVLTGAGRAFMAGGDIASMAGTPDQAGGTISAILDAVNPAILLLRGMDAPVIAAVKGVAAGAGLSLAMMADIIVAEENTKFLVAYNGIGAVPDCGGSWFLPHRVGAGRASEMMILGRTLAAPEARDWGLINTVAPDEQFESVLTATVAKAAEGPGQAFGAFRRLVDQASGGNSLAEHLEAERQAFLAMTRTTDFSEGVSAFLAKRKPRFKGY